MPIRIDVKHLGPGKRNTKSSKRHLVLTEFAGFSSIPKIVHSDPNFPIWYLPNWQNNYFYLQDIPDTHLEHPMVNPELCNGFFLLWIRNSPLSVPGTSGLKLLQLSSQKDTEYQLDWFCHQYREQDVDDRTTVPQPITKNKTSCPAGVMINALALHQYSRCPMRCVHIWDVMWSPFHGVFCCFLFSPRKSSSQE